MVPVSRVLYGPSMLAWTEGHSLQLFAVFLKLFHKECFGSDVARREYFWSALAHCVVSQQWTVVAVTLRGGTNWTLHYKVHPGQREHRRLVFRCLCQRGFCKSFICFTCCFNEVADWFMRVRMRLRIS